ncbi:replicative DNA helicase [Helicobacter sp. MIT 14-3879]|uniref:replicative DNA helicase n=1 Tax=Helicobacter sp. MIT 14-3879 TaxID=2040649 RepID=UPI000E1F902F|nr:replicative DNA helicase [Helicobacter sp. MIT 14-3879]RDU60839.1 replicative DNA helicase [Helicobacter sp. MIT 14-3879]
MKDIYNIQIECSLLATILFDPQIFSDVEGELDSSDFGYENHRIIFNIMTELYKTDLPINEDFIRKKVNNKNINFDNDLFNIVTTSPIVGIKKYIDEIKDLSLKRKLHSLANHIKEQSLELNMSSVDIIDNIENEVFKLQSSKNNSEFRILQEITHSMLDKIKEQKEHNSILLGIDTGFSELNRITSGFKEGELIVLAARPAMGKTAFAINVLQPTLKQNKSVAFFSLEMDAEQIILRMLSSMTSIPMQNLIIGNLDNNDWEYFSNMCNKISSWKLYVDDSGNLNISKLKSKIRKLKLKNPDLSLVVIDYLQIMSGINNKDRHLEIAEISRGLKNLAREIRIPILALSQLNRELEKRGDKRPMLSDLRESGAIEQDADIILFLYRDSIYQIRAQKEKLEKAKKEGKEIPKEIILEEKEIEEAELIIGKHRNGPIGTIKLNMHTKYTRFTSQTTHNEIEHKETEMLNMPI